MDKKDAVRIICNCAELYHRNLENTNLRFIYGDVDDTHIFDVAFLPRNFQHLTGVTINQNRPQSSAQFYRRCLSRHLSDKDIMFADESTTQLKLEVLPTLMADNIGAKMIGDYDNSRPTLLYTGKLVGTIYACMGFVFEEKSGLYIPNTVLKTDIRNVVQASPARILGTLQKDISEKSYSRLVYRAKGITEKLILAAAQVLPTGENKGRDIPCL